MWPYCFLWLLIWCSVYSCFAAELTKDFHAKENKREKGLGITDRIFVIIYILKRLNYEFGEVVMVR